MNRKTEEIGTDRHVLVPLVLRCYQRKIVCFSIMLLVLVTRNSVVIYSCLETDSDDDDGIKIDK